jgi:hypothetical protein
MRNLCTEFLEVNSPDDLLAAGAFLGPKSNQEQAEDDDDEDDEDGYKQHKDHDDDGDRNEDGYSE